MAHTMKRIAACSSFLTVVCVVLYQNTANDLALSLAITWGTISYHFIMRLFVGHAIDLLLKNRVDYQARWFQVSDAERKLYKYLKVKNWKKRMPTYDPTCFDHTIHSWDEIAQAMCQAELVHEIIILFSFLPILAAIPFGALPVFIITSILAACLDATFVVMQRYNRPRIIKLIHHDNKTEMVL